MPPESTLTEALLEEICQAFNRQDVEAIAGYFAEDGEWLMASGPEVPWARRCVGRVEIARVLRERFAIIPDMRWAELRHFVAGDRATSEWRVLGTPVDAPPLDWLGCDLWTFEAGLIVRKDTYWKTILAR